MDFTRANRFNKKAEALGMKSRATGEIHDSLNIDFSIKEVDDILVIFNEMREEDAAMVPSSCLTLDSPTLRNKSEYNPVPWPLPVQKEEN